MNLAAIRSGDTPAGAHRLDLSAMLNLRSPNAFAVEDIAGGGRDLVHSAIGRYTVHSKHAHLDMLVQLVIELPSMHGLRLGNVERQDLLYGVSGYNDVNPAHVHAPNLSGLFRYFCYHDGLPFRS